MTTYAGARTYHHTAPTNLHFALHVGDAESAAHGAYAQMHAKDAQRKKRAA